jgi:biotin transport system permease protein
MDRELSPFSYRNRPSPLHRLPAGGKLIFFLTGSAAVFLFGFAALLPGVIVLLALASIANISAAELLRGSRLLLISAILVLALRSLNFTAPYFSPKGFLDGLRFALSMVFCFAAGSLFFSVSSRSGILASLSRTELVIRSFFPRLLRRPEPGPSPSAKQARNAEPKTAYPFFSLAVSLMLGFIPRFFSLWDDMEKAYAARGGRPGPGKLRLLVPPAGEAMLESAAETEKALEARGF